MDWLLQVAAIIIFARVAGILSRKIGVSALFGEILFGIFLGTVVLWQGWHFDTHVIEALSEIGIIFLIFIIGLETDVWQVLSVGIRGILVAILGVVLPFAAGYYVSHFYGYDTKTSLFVASTFTATSVAISARVFMDLNYVGHRASQTVLVAAVVDDVLGFLVFTGVLIMETTAGEGGSADLMSKILPAVLFLLIFLPLMWVGTGPLYKFLDRFGAEPKFVLIIGILLAISFMANAAGLAAIIGAFFFGLALSMRRDPEFIESSTPIFLIFAPIFFVFMGFQVNVGALWNNIGMAGVLIITAILSKLVGAMAGVMLCRGSWREALVVSIGMVPRGEVGLIIASIGKKLNVIDDSLFGAVTLMCIFTTLIAPFPLRKAIEYMVAGEKKEVKP